ncbi:MAG: hypothetical protein JW876_00010 [Candidatus Krumholzibacteriota bacterium]|nr:hypothetical protein [Candidatus Krumholzibacteriota bacterium]
MPSLIMIILGRKRLLIAVAAGAFVLSAAVSLVIPSRYVATVSFVPAGVERDLAGTADFFTKFGSFGDAYRSIVRVRRNSVVDVVMRSRPVAALMDARFGLAGRYRADGVEEVRRGLRERTSVTVTDEGVIVVGVEDREAAVAASMAGAYVELVDSFLVEMAVGGAAGERRFLEEEIARRERRIARADSAIGSFMAENRIWGLEAQARAMVEAGALLTARLDALEVERRFLETTLRGDNPQLSRIGMQIDALRGEIDAMKRGGREDALFPPLAEMPALGARYLHMIAGRRVEEFAMAYLQLRLAETRYNEHNRGSVLRMIDPPMVPEKRVWPRRKQIVLVSTAAALFWACFFLLAAERRRAGAAS